jgi:hypothetical protein
MVLKTPSLTKTTSFMNDPQNTKDGRKKSICVLKRKKIDKKGKIAEEKRKKMFIIMENCFNSNAKIME